MGTMVCVYLLHLSVMFFLPTVFGRAVEDVEGVTGAIRLPLRARQASKRPNYSDSALDPIDVSS